MTNQHLWSVIDNALSDSIPNLYEVDSENAATALVGVLGWVPCQGGFELPFGIEVLVDFGGNEYHVCTLETNDLDGVCWKDVDDFSRRAVYSNQQWKRI